MTAIEIRHLAAHVPAKSRGNPLRREDLAASRTDPRNPPLAHAVAIAQIAIFEKPRGERRPSVAVKSRNCPDRPL
jgi:hypothetical protein